MGVWHAGQRFLSARYMEIHNNIPRDVLMADYWQNEQYLRVPGFDVVEGNFLGNYALANFPDWVRRTHVPFFKGAAVSTWCDVSAYAFGHNLTALQAFQGCRTAVERLPVIPG